MRMEMAINKEGKEKGMELEIMKLAIAIAIIAGIWTAAYIYITAKSESYSAFYIQSHSNYIENGTVSFEYGVDRFGPAGASYSFEVLERGAQYHAETFEMGPGETRRMNVSFYLNETSFPVKVQLILQEGNGEIYETYFWLKGVKE